MNQTNFIIDNITSEVPDDSANPVFNTIYITLPEYFYHSKNPKSISIQYVKVYDLMNNKEIVSSMYSNLNQLNISANYYICSCNTVYAKDKKYNIMDSTQKFEVWLKHMNGSLVNINPRKSRVIIEMLLEY